MYLSFVQFFKQMPFVRLIIPFILGIVLRLNFEYKFEFYFYTIILLFGLLLLTENRIKESFSFKYRFVSGIIVNFLLIILGSYLLQINTADKFNSLEKDLIAEAVISNPLSEKKNSYKTVANISRYSVEGKFFLFDNKIVLYFEKDSAINSLKYGDKIIFKSKINEIKNMGNPYEFDYKKFLFQKGIVAQSYIKKTNWKIINEHKASEIYFLAYNIRDFLAKVYRDYNIKNQEFAVLQALTLGNKGELDEDLKKAYVASGAMHILAVSGLHVGIIYLMLNFFLRFLDKFKIKEVVYGIYIKAAILIGVLWLFALVSGLSSSVTRAALMFSFIIIGKAIKKKVNIYNSLAVSAFILLLIDPYKITDVGFQLSYAAVIAIIHFHPKIVNLFVVKNKILFYIWSLTAVSIAAQIGTAPISMYYFHVFPNYFIITNIVVIPLATIIIYGAAGLLVTSFLPFIPDFFALFLKKVILVLNFSVEKIETLPFSHFENVSFNTHDLFFSVFVIIFFAFFIHYKQTKDLLIVMLLLFIWLAINTFNKISVNTEDRIFVYNIKDVTAINFLGKRNILIADSSVFKNRRMNYGIMRNWIHFNKKEYDFIDLKNKDFSNNYIFKRKKYLKINSKKLLIINNANQINFSTERKMLIDYIVFSENPNIEVADVLNLYNAGVLIFDSTNDYNRIQNWKDECEKLKQNYHFVCDGAFFEFL